MCITEDQLNPTTKQQKPKTHQDIFIQEKSPKLVIILITIVPNYFISKSVPHKYVIYCRTILFKISEICIIFINISFNIITLLLNGCPLKRKGFNFF